MVKSAKGNKVMVMVIRLVVMVVVDLVGCSRASVVPSRTHCPEGYIMWPVDLTCHRPFYQGPCPPGKVLTNPPQGPECGLGGSHQDDQQLDLMIGGDSGWGLKTFVVDQLEIPEVETDQTIQWELPQHPQTIEQFTWQLPQVSQTTSEQIQFPESWQLPQGSHSYISSEEATCLSRDQIWWPSDGQCYSLLEQGPCGPGEWLVLSVDQVVCRHRICPCDPSQPDLCEVEVEHGPCKCRVALAAAQDGICQVGEQLLVSPYGTGVCGCMVSPPHTVWPGDGRCYPVHSQGPCDLGFVFSVSRSSMEAVCLPSVCQKGEVNFQGDCHPLGSKGPCAELEILNLDPDSLEPQCMMTISKVKRVYDIIPNNRGLVLDGPLSKSLKVNNCKVDSRGKCRKSFFVKRSFKRGGGVSRDRQVNLYIRKRSPRKYLRWLQSFRRKKL